MADFRSRDKIPFSADVLQLSTSLSEKAYRPIRLKLALNLTNEKNVCHDVIISRVHYEKIYQGHDAGNHRRWTL